MVRLLICFLIANVCAFGVLADHLKKIENKEGYSSIRNVDFTYMINLDERPEKFAASVEQLEPYGIFPYRFSAVNGWKLSLETINDVGVKYKKWMKKGIMGTWYPMDGSEHQHEVMSVKNRNYFVHCMSRGAIGICLSHLSIMKDALDSGYETIWIMEDDIEVLQDPRIISDLIDELDALVGKDGWDFLFTDVDIKSNLTGEYVPCFGMTQRPDFTQKNPRKVMIREPVGEKFRLVGGRYGGHSMIIRRSGLEKLWNHYKKYQIFYPIDIEYILPDDIKLFTVLEDVVGNKPNSLSDNGAPYYEK
jgi:GR25 family glycosyltransferase involved in LPS biosynthesis